MEPAHVAVESDPDWIGFDESDPGILVEGRKPSGQASQFRHDDTVFTGHEREDAARGNAALGLDAVVEKTRTEELAQLAVHGYETTIRAAGKEVRLESPQQCRMVAIGNVLGAENTRPFRFIQGRALPVGQQEECR